MMYLYLRRMVKCLVVLGWLLLPLASQAQLSGSYTINPKNSASSTNYQNWASAVGDLLTGTRTDGGTAQGAGVSGAVTFTVYDTVYNTQISLSAITGASASNTITFKSAGGDSSKCVVSYASSTSSANDYVLQLNGVN